MASNLVIRLVEERFEEVDIDMDDHGHADARDFDGEVTVVAVADEHAFAAGEGAGGDAYPFAPFQLFDIAHLDFDFGGEEIFEHLDFVILEGDDMGDAVDGADGGELQFGDASEGIGLYQRRFDPFFAVAPVVEFPTDREIRFDARRAEILVDFFLGAGVSI